MTPLVFPQDQPDGKAGLARQGGLELRDYFAAQALPLLVQEYALLGAKRVAVEAYRYADAMLNARGGDDDA